LAALSDLLERRALLEDAEEFAGELRESSHRFHENRKRFASLVLSHSQAMRETNASLTRELDHLRRLQSLARFFAAPGPRETFGDRFACVLGKALRASGAALVRQAANGVELEGLWRISARNARAQTPASGMEWARPARVRSGRKGTQGMWLPFGESLPEWGIVALFPSMGPKWDEDCEACLALAADGLAARLSAEAKVERHVQSETILRSVRGGLLKMDARDRVVMANPALAALLGAPLSALEGRPLAEVFARDPHLIKILQAIRSGAGGGDEIETYVTSASGAATPVSIRASLVPGEGGASILALLFDLSRRKEVESEMRRAERLVALGRLSAGVAHEIRNPLAGIRTTAELLKSRFTPADERMRFVDVILEESQRLDRIVGSLLQFARPAEPKVERVDLETLLERALDLAAGRAAELRVLLRNGSLPGKSSVLADRDQILQVLLNLLLNGIEATGPGGEVVVSCAAVVADGNEACSIRIQDGGEGVPAALRERIFDPFFTTKPGGTGLGLSISEYIVRRHGGSIRFEKDGSGAHAAILTLPAGWRHPGEE
jgi:PAS domain S-box-containing protein